MISFSRPQRARGAPVFQLVAESSSEDLRSTGIDRIRMARRTHTYHVSTIIDYECSVLGESSVKKGTSSRSSRYRGSKSFTVPGIK